MASFESLSFVSTAVELRVRFGFNCFAREKKNGNTRNSRAVPLSDQMWVLVVGDECARPHFVAKNPVITDLQPEPAINRETWSKVLAVFLSEKRRGGTEAPASCSSGRGELVRHWSGESSRRKGVVVVHPSS